GLSRLLRRRRWRRRVRRSVHRSDLRLQRLRSLRRAQRSWRPVRVRWPRQGRRLSASSRLAARPPIRPWPRPRRGRRRPLRRLACREWRAAAAWTRREAGRTRRRCSPGPSSRRRRSRCAALYTRSRAQALPTPGRSTRRSGGRRARARPYYAPYFQGITLGGYGLLFRRAVGPCVGVGVGARDRIEARARVGIGASAARVGAAVFVGPRGIGRVTSARVISVRAVFARLCGLDDHLALRVGTVGGGSVGASRGRENEGENEGEGAQRGQRGCQERREERNESRAVRRPRRHHCPCGTNERGTASSTQPPLGCGYDWFARKMLAAQLATPGEPMSFDVTLAAQRLPPEPTRTVICTRPLSCESSARAWL